MCSTFPAYLHTVQYLQDSGAQFVFRRQSPLYLNIVHCAEDPEFQVVVQSFHAKHISPCTKAMAAPQWASHEDARRMIIITLVIVPASDYQQPARIMWN